MKARDIMLVAGVVLFLFAILPAATVFAEDIHYGRVVDMDSSTLLIQYAGLKDNFEQWFACSGETMSCTQTASTTTLLPASLSGKSYLISAAKDRALVSEPGNNNLLKHSLVSITPTGVETLAVLPVTEPIRRVLWSNPGSPLVLITASGHIVRYSSSDNTFEYLDPLPDGAGILTLSPNGRYLAYYISSTQTRQTRTYGIIDTLQNKSYTKTEKVTYWDLLSEGIKFFAFSPDSTRLLYLGDTDGPQTLYQVTLKSLSDDFPARRIISKNYSVSDFIWIDTASILFTANRDNPLAWSLYSYNISTGVLTKHADNISYASTMKPFGKYIAFNHIVSNSSNPVFFDTSQKSVRKLIIPGLVVEHKPLGEIVQVGTLHGVYTKATAIDPALSKTLLVWLHGGPFRQTSNGFHSYMSYAGYDWMLAEASVAGVAVLKLDYPGSFGYGRPFAEKVTENVGVVDVKETLVAVEQFAAKRGFKNIYLIGNSYGGYLSLKAIVDHPTKFAGAFSINGVTDWGLLNERLQTSIFNVQFNGLPDESNKSLYTAASIVKSIGNLGQQKVVLAHGDSDTTIPVEQSQILYEELASRSKNAELVTFADEDHVYENEETFESLCSRVLQFVGASAISRCEL